MGGEGEERRVGGEWMHRAFFPRWVARKVDGERGWIRESRPGSTTRAMGGVVGRGEKSRSSCSAVPWLWFPDTQHPVATSRGVDKGSMQPTGTKPLIG